MKKAIAWLMLMVMASMSWVAVAEETAGSSEVLFRDIPWGASPKEAEAILREQLVDATFAYSQTSREYGEFKKFGSGFGAGNVTYPSITMLECVVTASELTVAGQKTGKDIVLYYLPVLSEDGTSYELSEDAGLLWYGVYEEVKIGKADLLTHLNSIYGEENYAKHNSDDYNRQTKEIVRYTQDYWQIGTDFVVLNGTAHGMEISYLSKQFLDQVTAIERIESAMREEHLKKQEHQDTLTADTDGL